MSIFPILIRYKIRPLLIYLQKTLNDVAKNDLTLDKEDLENIRNLSNFIFFNPKMLIQYSNLLLKNQNTILRATRSDRDFMIKSKQLRDKIINLNHSTVTSENTEELLEGILRNAIDTIKDSVAGSVMTPDSKGKMEYVAAIGMDLQMLKKTKFKLKDTFVYKLNKSKKLKPVIIRNKKKLQKNSHSIKDNQFIEKSGANTFPCALSAPIIIDNKIYGILTIDSSSNKAFNQDDIRMMEYFTSEMSVVIKNSELIKNAIYFSRYDALTNVHNRHYFEDIAQMSFDEAVRYKVNIHIVLFDLNNFKLVNDTYGHEIGDRALKLFANTIQDSIRGSDVFARYGGDEFIALFRNSKTTDIEKRIFSINKELSLSPLVFDGISYIVKFSYGVSEFPGEAGNLDELIKIADQNMYKNKKEG